jgi:very-short-patch-repair endonuclease
VLEDNGISFIREDHTNGKYFLDFLIEKNNIRIDLEIDGKQHKYRVQHDLMRDEFLTANGYVVYRVEWNEINSESGKKLMKSKIDDFINFYNNL